MTPNWNAFNPENAGERSKVMSFNLNIAMVYSKNKKSTRICPYLVEYLKL